MYSRFFWHSNVGPQTKKGYIEEHWRRLFIAQRDHLSTYLICSYPSWSDVEKNSHGLSPHRDFHRNNMLIARRRSLKSAPINSRDFWRNFAPSRYNHRLPKDSFCAFLPSSWKNFTLPLSTCRSICTYIRISMKQYIWQILVYRFLHLIIFDDSLLSIRIFFRW